MSTNRWQAAVNAALKSRINSDNPEFVAALKRRDLEGVLDVLAADPEIGAVFDRANLRLILEGIANGERIEGGTLRKASQSRNIRYRMSTFYDRLASTLTPVDATSRAANATEIHSSALWTFGSTSRGPQATPISRQSDGLAAIASRQHSVSPFDATGRILAGTA